VKSIWAIAFLAGGIFLSLRSAWFATDYLVHKSEIIEAFCENKDKPQLHCDGKCYLAQKLNARYEARKDAENTQRQLRVELNFLFYFFDFLNEAGFSEDMLQKTRFAIPVLYCELESVDLDTPPPRA
jgi:hypothetical protein